MARLDPGRTSEPLPGRKVVSLDSRYYTGLIDEVKVFDVALTEAEIAEASAPAAVDAAGKLAKKVARFLPRLKPVGGIAPFS